MSKVAVGIAAVFTAASSAYGAAYQGGVDTFTAGGVLGGSILTAEECAETQKAWPDTAVWVVVEGKGDCIRYFHAGLQGTNEKVIVYFSGDLNKVAEQARRERKTVGSPSGLQDFATGRSSKGGLPFIYLARPGIHGSSGDHGRRRLPREGLLIDAALTQIKAKYNIKDFSLTGQSGGGHVVAVLLTKRDDVLCAIPTSGAVAVEARYRSKGLTVDTTGYNSLDPIRIVASIPRRTDRRIFVAASHTDSNVPFDTQKSYADAVKAEGHDVHVVSANGYGSEGHGLTDLGIALAYACAWGVPTQAVLQAAATAKDNQRNFVRAIDAATQKLARSGRVSLALADPARFLFERGFDSRAEKVWYGVEGNFALVVKQGGDSQLAASVLRLRQKAGPSRYAVCEGTYDAAKGAQAECQGNGFAARQLTGVIPNLQLTDSGTAGGARFHLDSFDPTGSTRKNLAHEPPEFEAWFSRIRTLVEAARNFDDDD
jgi:hypothetical protein